MIAHFGVGVFKGTNYYILFKFAQEAVMLFFLLSGFVIYISFIKNPNISFKSYFIKRFRRIYFPVFCTYLISGLIYFKLNNTLDISLKQIIGNLLMLQDFSIAKPGVWIEPIFNNGPLWSLSYEWWFYMLFFPIVKLFPKIKIFSVLIFSSASWILYLLIPNQVFLIFSYFIIWWSGLEAAKVFINKKQLNFKNTWHINLSLFLISLLVSVPIFSLQTEEMRVGFFPLLTFRHFFSVFIIFNVGLIWYKFKLFGFNKLNFISHLAPISYAIYLIHRPIYSLTLSPYFIIDTISKFILIILLSYIIEVILQPRFNKLLKRIINK